MIFITTEPENFKFSLKEDYVNLKEEEAAVEKFWQEKKK